MLAWISARRSAGARLPSPFRDRFRCEEECLPDVFALEVGVESKDVVHAVALGDERDDGRHGDAEAPQAWNATHLSRVGRDAAASALSAPGRQSISELLICKGLCAW